MYVNGGGDGECVLVLVGFIRQCYVLLSTPENYHLFHPSRKGCIASSLQSESLFCVSQVSWQLRLQ